MFTSLGISLISNLKFLLRSRILWRVGGEHTRTLTHGSGRSREHRLYVEAPQREAWQDREHRGRRDNLGAHLSRAGGI